MKTLQEDVKLNSFKKVYLLFGEEAYLRRTWRDKLIAAMLPEGDTMNLTKYVGKGVKLDEVLAMSQTMPFFAERRVLVLEDTGYFKNATEGLKEGIEALPESTCMIFVESEVDKRGKAFKSVKQEGYAAELNTPDSKMLVTWLIRIANDAQKQMDPKTASMILEYCGMDMLQLSHEMDKLISYAYERPVISVADVEEICVSQITGKIFEMMDAITARQPERTLMLYHDLLTLREAPLKILSLLTRQIRILTEIKGLLDDKVEYGQLASKVGIPPFTVKKYTSQCKNYPYSELLSMFEACQQTEEQIKTGQVGDVIGVELLIVGFSKKK